MLMHVGKKARIGARLESLAAGATPELPLSAGAAVAVAAGGAATLPGAGCWQRTGWNRPSISNGAPRNSVATRGSISANQSMKQSIDRWKQNTVIGQNASEKPTRNRTESGPDLKKKISIWNFRPMIQERGETGHWSLCSSAFFG